MLNLNNVLDISSSLDFWGFKDGIQKDLNPCLNKEPIMGMLMSFFLKDLTFLREVQQDLKPCLKGEVFRYDFQIPRVIFKLIWRFEMTFIVCFGTFKTYHHYFTLGKTRFRYLRILKSNYMLNYSKKLDKSSIYDLRYCWVGFSKT